MKTLLGILFVALIATVIFGTRDEIKMNTPDPYAQKIQMQSDSVKSLAHYNSALADAYGELIEKQANPEVKKILGQAQMLSLINANGNFEYASDLSVFASIVRSLK